VHSISNGYFGFARYPQGGTDQPDRQAGSAANVRRPGPAVSFGFSELIAAFGKAVFSMAVIAIPQSGDRTSRRDRAYRTNRTRLFIFKNGSSRSRADFQIKRDTEQNGTDVCASPC
jgi:hypothetical protein